MTQPPGIADICNTTLWSTVSDFNIEDRSTLTGKDQAPGDEPQYQQREAQKYRRAIQNCSEEELQELLMSIRSVSSLAEARQQALDLKYC
ncbi:hypothetical protein N7481_010199 [Penicillium waksmanii]|uniref:uncharacterized protein n=1 Tax=Penicillium waksmanii TaxID=69791 RepID=UPI0025476DEF|nr:uncharacterized protein N7481_010199 [Penicillium waksmanii]KAJ5976492.1 hypothetical protein N7481_010199 [Penicillium waksmanii]